MVKMINNLDDVIEKLEPATNQEQRRKLKNYFTAAKHFYENYVSISNLPDEDDPMYKKKETNGRCYK